jgi:xylulokinase
MAEMLLGIDLGTTHVKACAYDDGGRLLAVARHLTPTRRLPGGAEYDARSLEQAAFAAARETVKASSPPCAVGVSSVGEAGFLVEECGEALAPAIAWFDGRTAAQAARWRERIPPEELFARTGLHTTPLFSACKLEWTRENVPGAWSRATGWLGIAEYLAFRMTGERGTDPSLAGRTMLYRIADDEWDGELCELAGVPKEWLPPVYPSGASPGRLTEEVAAEISASPGVPVVVCGHDHICGSFGAGASRPREIVDSMGTAEASLLTLERPPLDASGYKLGLPVGRHVLPETYYVAATLPRSGGLVEQLVKLLGGHAEDLARWTEQARDLLPGAGGTCLPPTNDNPDEEGLLLTSLGNESTPGHLLRAVLEGLTLRMHSDLRRAIRATNIEPSGVTLLGGGAQNRLWSQLKADVSNLPVRVVSDPECVARGAAMLAAVGAGVFPDVGSVPTPDYEADLKPSGDHSDYERLYTKVYEPLLEHLRQAPR